MTTKSLLTPPNSGPSASPSSTPPPSDQSRGVLRLPGTCCMVPARYKQTNRITINECKKHFSHMTTSSCTSSPCTMLVASTALAHYSLATLFVCRCSLAERCIAVGPSLLSLSLRTPYLALLSRSSGSSLSLDDCKCPRGSRSRCAVISARPHMIRVAGTS
jgi:hypothetical protein